MKQNYLYLWYPLFHTQWNMCDKHNHQTTGIPGENHRNVANFIEDISPSPGFEHTTKSLIAHVLVNPTTIRPRKMNIGWFYYLVHIGLREDF